MKLSNEILKNIKKKNKKKNKTYLIDVNVLKSFEIKCNKLDLKYSNVVEMLMLAFLRK